MRKRKLLVVLAGLVVMGAARAVVLWPEARSRIPAESCRRVREGMNRADDRRAGCHVGAEPQPRGGDEAAA